MAKFYGSMVKTGRVGGSVFRIRGGETIESQYQPTVFNPSTQAQVQARAKFKLLSQLAEVLAPALAFRKEGNVSARNAFLKRNYDLATYSSNEASVDLAQVSLTGGLLAYGGITAVRQSGGGYLNVTIPVNNTVDKVVSAVFVEAPTGLRMVTMRVDNMAAESITYNAEVSASYPCVVLGYGVRLNTENARARYTDMSVDVADSALVVTAIRMALDSDVSLTETQGLRVPVSAGA